MEQHWLDQARETFERYGYGSIETPAVESLDVLEAKGETSQEIYVLQRLHATDEAAQARYGLHFDLTVPVARYVAQHFNDLVFPFKRYQMQRVWRGERPQEGRFREFLQCDIDVIDVDKLPLHFDAEMPRIVHEVLTELRIGPFSISVNNRKVLQGFYEAIGIEDPIAVIRVVDKLDKIGADGVGSLLRSQVGLAEDQVRACLDLAQLRGTPQSVVEAVGRLVPPTSLLREGLDELAFVLDELADLPAGSVIADLSIARGLDYYTGTVYEGKFSNYPGYGTITSGGRYDDLAGSFIRRRLPGVGMSIGLTRIFAKLLAENVLCTGPKSPTQVLVLVQTNGERSEAAAVAAQLRDRGLNVEVYHQADRVEKQLRYGSRKGIPFAWFPPGMVGNETHEVKDLGSGAQTQADPAVWLRPS